MVFTDPLHIASRVLLPALLAALRPREDIYCACICIPDHVSTWRQQWDWHLARGKRRLQVMLASGRWEQSLDLRTLNLYRLAQPSGTAIMVMPTGDPNHASILRCIDQLPGTPVAINLYCTRRFRQPLLERFDRVVNYHNGSLPGFRGWRVSNWALYMGAPSSGLSFHLMTEAVDAGHILATTQVPVRTHDTAAELELRKALAARALLPALLDSIVACDDGRAQHGIACEYNRSAYELATRVTDPSALCREEWERRLRAFLRIQTQIDGRWWPVTAIGDGENGAPLSFTSADHQRLSVTGLDFWPASWIHRINPRHNRA
ncbi:formyltransferase family protein [Rhodoferax sp.]|uniref:formyltransferase family protein n=1 Tax=Rhodoferax sp. TaxID=50421 RepID=UPI00260DD493|nr:formyltransferase family protein [Rhodoferax sp.]MDD2919828.1 formyltransferase family protein [Rhodoferax sp.]